MADMSNQAYLSIRCKDFPEERILERFGSFLATVPFSATKPGFTYLVIRAVDYTEVPLLEQDLRSAPLDAEGIVEIARYHLHSDCSYEVHSHWDLWVFDSEAGRWQLQPQTLELFCHGEDHDGGSWQEKGHLEANLGFEHLFTGHAGLLGIRRIAKSLPQSPEEEQFLASMAQLENLQMYQEKTRENIRKLLDWIRRIEKVVPVDRDQLFSEGEENFELRVEEILAVH
jgi:hypothetical protein